MKKNEIFGQPFFPPFCFVSQRLIPHVSVIHQLKGIFVLYNIGLTFIYRKMSSRGPKTGKMVTLGGHLENDGNPQKKNLRRASALISFRTLNTTYL